MRTVASAAPADVQYDEATILAALSPDDRRAFLALDPAERRFLLTAHDEERAVYAQLPPPEQTRFARLTPPLRQVFLRLTPDERRSTSGMDDAGLLRFLQGDRSGRSAFEGSPNRASRPPSAPPPASPASPAAAARVARELKDAMAGLGADPAAIGPAAALAHNLIVSGMNEDRARTVALRTYLLAPEVTPVVLRALSPRVSPELLRRSLAFLPELVAEAITGDMDAEHVLSSLVDALKSKLVKRVRPARVPGVLGERVSLLQLAMVGGIAG